MYALCVSLIFLLIGNGCFAKHVTQQDPFEQALLNESPRHLTATTLKSFIHQYSHLRCRQEDARLVNRSQNEFGQAFGNYISEIYNKADFADTLSQDGTHVIEFLELAGEIGLTAEQVCVVMRLFYNKMKSCEIVDDTMLTQVFRRMPRLLAHYFKPVQERHMVDLEHGLLQRRIENMLLMRFTEYYDRFHDAPDQFLADLSRELAELYKRHDDGVVKSDSVSSNVERLRSIVQRWNELVLSKVWWGMHSREGIWRSFLELENGLHQLAITRIIDHRDDLDDLHWTLLKRFCYFLDLEAQNLPVCLFEEIENDIEQGVVQFLEMPEQDSYITTKKEVLQTTLFSAKTRAIAYQQGMLTQEIHVS